MILDSVDASTLFAAGMTTSSQLDGMQQRSLAQGIDSYQSGNYEQAIKDFTRAVGYSPKSDNAVKAYQFISQAYSKLGDSEGAINAYKQALKIAPSNADLHVALGNIYYYQKNFDGAVSEYEAAVNNDPTDVNRYYLGQGYMSVGNYNDAENQFRLVKALSPNNPQGDYGLGLVNEKRGQYDAAIRNFQDALSVKSDYYEAYSEMGYALADSGRLNEAGQIQSDLASIGSLLASQLKQYIDSKTPPKLLYVSSDNFNTQTLGPGTSVSALDGYLATPNAYQVFSVQFYFTKAMDATSVQNILNWTISRSANAGAGSGYNYGMPLANTEVSLPPHPLSVYFDENTQSATVFFVVSQNSAGNGTIDPRHIQFTFSGKDSDGLKMDGQADQYAGFSGIA